MQLVRTGQRDIAVQDGVFLTQSSSTLLFSFSPGLLWVRCNVSGLQVLSPKAGVPLGPSATHSLNYSEYEGTTEPFLLCLPLAELPGRESRGSLHALNLCFC